MTQIQAYEDMSKEALIEHHRHTLQQHADDMDMLSKELASRAAPVDPYRVLMADQAELINIERLQRWLTKYGISTPESLEELGAKRGHYVNALTRQEPFSPAAPAALCYAAKVIELYDDATMRADYMLTSTDCAEILEALAEYFTAHPRVSEPQLVKVYKINDISGSVDSDLSQPCTCPSGNGSLRWPCPVHPPESVKSLNQQVAVLPKDEWIKRCARRFMVRSHTTKKIALEIAESCYSNMGDDYIPPKDAADEEMTYWNE